MPDKVWHDEELWTVELLISHEQRDLYSLTHSIYHGICLNWNPLIPDSETTIRLRFFLPVKNFSDTLDMADQIGVADMVIF